MRIGRGRSNIGSMYFVRQDGIGVLFRVRNERRSGIGDVDTDVVDAVSRLERERPGGLQLSKPIVRKLGCRSRSCSSLWLAIKISVPANERE